MFNPFKTVLRLVRSIFAKKSQNPDDSQHAVISGPSIAAMRYREFCSLGERHREDTIFQAHKVYKRIQYSVESLLKTDESITQEYYDGPFSLGPVFLVNVVYGAMAQSPITSTLADRMEAKSIPFLMRQAASADEAIESPSRASHNRNANDPEVPNKSHGRNVWNAVKVLVYVRNLVAKMEEDPSIIPKEEDVDDSAIPATLSATDQAIRGDDAYFTLFSNVLFHILVITEENRDLQSAITREVGVFATVTGMEPDLEGIRLMAERIEWMERDSTPIQPYHLALCIMQEVMISVRRNDNA